MGSVKCCGIPLNLVFAITDWYIHHFAGEKTRNNRFLPVRQLKLSYLVMKNKNWLRRR